MTIKTYKKLKLDLRLNEFVDGKKTEYAEITLR
jgi:hypothetical protein